MIWMLGSWEYAKWWQWLFIKVKNCVGRSKVWGPRVSMLQLVLMIKLIIQWIQTCCNMTHRIEPTQPDRACKTLARACTYELFLRNVTASEQKWWVSNWDQVPRKWTGRRNLPTARSYAALQRSLMNSHPMIISCLHSSSLRRWCSNARYVLRSTHAINWIWPPSFLSSTRLLATTAKDCQHVLFQWLAC